MKTTSPTAPAKTPPQQRDFAEAMHALYVVKDGHAAAKHRALIIPAVLLVFGGGIGSAARMLLPPAWAVPATGLLAVLLTAWAVLAACLSYQTGPLQRVDWDTADDYQQRLIAGLSPDARTILARVQQQIRRRFPAAQGVHLYCPDRLPEHECTIDAGGCDCVRMRVNAGVLPNRTRPIIVVGDRVLAEPAALSYVLAHETNHTRRPWRQLHSLQQVLFLAGWLSMGLTLPWRTLAIVAPAVWLTALALNWANELAADIAAARATGPTAARAYWTMLRAARPTRTGLSRLTGAVMAVLAPTHPPMTWRAALADRIAHRPLP